MGILFSHRVQGVYCVNVPTILLSVRYAVGCRVTEADAQTQSLHHSCCLLAASFTCTGCGTKRVAGVLAHQLSSHRKMVTRSLSQGATLGLPCLCLPLALSVPPSPPPSRSLARSLSRGTPQVFTAVCMPTCVRVPRICAARRAQ